MKLWIDDIRKPPDGYTWVKTVNDAKYLILNDNIPNRNCKIYHIELIDIDHDAGIYKKFGGDYIKLLDWLEETNRRYPIHIHSMNPVGRLNMKAIIERNNWEEI